MRKEHGGIPSWYANHVMTRDARIIPCSDPTYREREGDPTCLNIETADDPPVKVEQVKVSDAVPADPNKGIGGSEAQFEEKRTILPNDSPLQAEPTINVHAPKE